jgi:zinc D-Ala-D-Ala dipeptidase
VAHFVRWAQRIDDVKRKREFYPDVDKRDLFKEGYISERSGHSRGSTVDLTLVRRADGRELDMGSPFDFFSPKSWPSDTSVGAQAQANRALLAAAMTRGGFRSYDKEWWHFTLVDEPFPDTYFDFPVSCRCQEKPKPCWSQHWLRRGPVCRPRSGRQWRLN